MEDGKNNRARSPRFPSSSEFHSRTGDFSPASNREERRAIGLDHYAPHWSGDDICAQEDEGDLNILACHLFHIVSHSGFDFVW